MTLEIQRRDIKRRLSKLSRLAPRQSYGAELIMDDTRWFVQPRYYLERNVEMCIRLNRVIMTLLTDSLMYIFILSRNTYTILDGTGVR